MKALKLALELLKIVETSGDCEVVIYNRGDYMSVDSVNDPEVKKYQGEDMQEQENTVIELSC